MFTGIVAAVGRIADVTNTTGGVSMRIHAGALDMEDVAIGDSIAVNGVCLTVVARVHDGFSVDVSRETLGCTAGFIPDAGVNLEKALRVSDRLGGHLVSGHVDGIGTVSRVEAIGDNRRLAFEIPSELTKYVARKGSVAVNGASLTVNEVRANEFVVNLIPHTLDATNLGLLRSGDRVNIEVDMLARYLEQLIAARS